MDTDRSCTATFDTSTTPTNNLTVIRSGAGAGINLRLTPELHPSRGSNLFVFALPE